MGANAASSSAAAWSMALLAGVFVGAIAPRVVGPSDRAAGEPFAYTPPEGLVPATANAPEGGDLDAATLSATRLWAKPMVPTLLGPPKYRPQISLVHTTKRAPIEEAELAAVAEGLPAMFASSGITWSETRHWTHLRPGGARVGIVAGDAVKGSLAYRMMQIAFPEDSGTSIVTASYPGDEAAKYEAEVEASIDRAVGVAFHAPPLSPWAHVGWGCGAALLTLLAMGLRVRKPALALASGPPSSTSTPTRG